MQRARSRAPKMCSGNSWYSEKALSWPTAGCGAAAPRENLAFMRRFQPKSKRKPRRSAHRSNRLDEARSNERGAASLDSGEGGEGGGGGLSGLGSGGNGEGEGEGGDGDGQGEGGVGRGGEGDADGDGGGQVAVRGRRRWQRGRRRRRTGKRRWRR